MSDRFSIIPTLDVAAVKPHLISASIEAGATPILIAPRHRRIPGAIVLQEDGATFDEWVNQGIEEALRHHADARVMVLGAHLDSDAASLDRMFSAMDRADIVCEPGRGTLHTPSKLTGHYFGFRAKDLRLPVIPGLALWWWNTDWFYWDAVDRGLTVEQVDGVWLDHYSDNDDQDGHWHYPEKFRWSVQADHDWFWSRFHHLDEAHTGCYLSWWPDALPEGQSHRVEWS